MEILGHFSVVIQKKRARIRISTLKQIFSVTINRTINRWSPLVTCDKYTNTVGVLLNSTDM